jgi:uncharacterized protein YecE (DUF72 family)
MNKATVWAGIGGWDYAPWRQSFYPPEVPLKRALEYASSVLTSIEINGTFYRNAQPEHFASWAARTPDDFVFAVKASRYATHRKALGEAEESIARFMASGLTELGDKLGPILWQLAATKRFDADELAAFFSLLPAKLGKRKLRHVLDARHASFVCDEYLALARRFQVATVITDSPKYPNFHALTGQFAYLRLMNAASEVATGYSKPALKTWATQAQAWRAEGRDAYVYFINGAKERAPAAAMQFLKSLG